MGDGGFLSDDARVLTERGWVKLLRVGMDEPVMASDGFRRMVSRERNDGLRMISIAPSCGVELHCTPDQELLVRRGIETPYWLPADEVDDSYYIGFRIPEETGIPQWSGMEHVTPDGRRYRTDTLTPLMGEEWFWELAGRFLSAGKFGYGENEGYAVIAFYDGRVHGVRFPHRTVGRGRNKVPLVCIESEEFALFCRSTDSVNIEKRRIPLEWTGLPPDLARALLRGIMLSRGNIDDEGWAMSFYSKWLAMDVVRLAAYAYHSPAQVRRIDLREKGATYRVTFGRDEDGRGFCYDGWMWTPVRSVDHTEVVASGCRPATEGSDELLVNGFAVRCREAAQADEDGAPREE